MPVHDASLLGLPAELRVIIQNYALYDLHQGKDVGEINGGTLAALCQFDLIYDDLRSRRFNDQPLVFRSAAEVYALRKSASIDMLLSITDVVVDLGQALEHVLPQESIDPVIITSKKSYHGRKAGSLDRLVRAPLEALPNLECLIIRLDSSPMSDEEELGRLLAIRLLRNLLPRPTPPYVDRLAVIEVQDTEVDAAEAEDERFVAQILRRHKAGLSSISEACDALVGPDLDRTPNTTRRRRLRLWQVNASLGAELGEQQTRGEILDE